MQKEQEKKKNDDFSFTPKIATKNPLGGLVASSSTKPGPMLNLPSFGGDSSSPKKTMIKL